MPAVMFGLLGTLAAIGQAACAARALLSVLEGRGAAWSALGTRLLHCASFFWSLALARAPVPPSVAVWPPIAYVPATTGPAIDDPELYDDT